MKIKWAAIVIVGYLLFSACMYYYLFVMPTGELPDIYKGTSADPATFLSEKERSLSGEFSKIKNFLFFLSTPLEWLIYFLVVLFGLSHRLEKWAQETVRITFWQTSIYLFYLSVFTFVLTFPLQYISFHLSKVYNISTQTFSQWMKDELIDFWIGYGLMMILIFVMYELMKRFKKRWWLAAWTLFVPFTIFLMYVQPVFIDPLYNDFYPLKDKQLEAKILSLADQANIPANHVYEVNMSEKTNALNAYVTGIGSNARIVLWDTTLNKLDEEEILFVMAHEMAHYVKKHIYIGIASYLVLAFIGFWLIAKIMESFINRKGEELSITNIAQLRTLPLILMMVSMLSFVVSPFSNILSRWEEKQSDAYAIEMTGNKAAAITAFQKLAKEGLSEVKPPLLVKIFRYSHPSMAERIYTIETYPLEETKEK
ncbi:M48 family metallopeptidase [Bacillus sp. REN10]|uniref:M48 family metallopeptidase n=1 Tax=Bacillus sp. REN10 TaxID=2782541 RepID=UPI00193C4975|nr:M48 family metallopeptidase [Bacillus sp. REN10]